MRLFQLLRSKHVNKCRKHVLQFKKHINYLHDFQRQFVLVPADKEALNVIVVCKNYYLDVVLNELSTTDTYVQDDRGSQCVILDHLQYMTKVNINVEPEHENLSSFYWLPKLHKNPYGKRFIAASNRCTTKSLSKLLTTCLAKITCHSRFLIGYVVKLIIFLQLNILISLIFLPYIRASHMILKK